MEMSSKNPLKQRLTHFLRPSTLRSSCNSASPTTIFTSQANTERTHSLSSSLAVDDPLLPIPSNSAGSIRNNPYKLERALFSSSSRMPSLNCNPCRPTRSLLEDNIVAVVKQKKKMKRSSEFYETGEREGKTCLHASPSSPLSTNTYSLHFERTREVQKEAHEKKDVKKKKKKKNMFSSNAYGFSSSADNDDDENGSDQFFSNDETEAFISSRSFSSDSSEFYKSSRKKKNKNKNKKQGSRKTSEVCDGFKPLVSVIQKERSTIDGIPVTKKSRDPYVDFRHSMVEMIVERQIFGAKDLEKLLHSYLSLNSPLLHSVIIRAFADISQVLFAH